MATQRYRIEWTTDAGQLAAVEVTLDAVRDHAAALSRGYNDPANAALLGHTQDLDEDDVVASYAELIADGGRAFLLFVDGAFVGDADLRHIHDNAAEFAFMIAARAGQGKGLGTRFALMVSTFAFETLALDRLYASIIPHNAASRRVFEKLAYALDESAAARAFADEPGDIVMSIDRSAFRLANDVSAVRINELGAT